MTRLKSSILAASAAVLVAAGLFFYLHRQHMREAAQLRAANGRLRLLVSRQYHERVVRAASISAKAAPSRAPDRANASAEDYRNEGRGTPLAAMQTFAWACDHGDTATVASMLSFDGGGRAKVEALLAAMPEASRGSWANPEEMAAALLTDVYMNHPFPNAAILDRAPVKSISDDRSEIDTRGPAKARSHFSGRMPVGTI